jgi:hypothetical protein
MKEWSRKNTLSSFFFPLSPQVSTEEKCYLLDSAYLETVLQFPISSFPLKHSGLKKKLKQIQIVQK